LNKKKAVNYLIIATLLLLLIALSACAKKNSKVKLLERMVYHDGGHITFSLIDVTTDYNFDNYMDISIYNGSGTGGQWFHIYIYNPNTKSFIYLDELSQLPSVWADAEKQTVNSYGKGGHAGLKYHYREFIWINEQLTLIQSEDQDYDSDLDLYIRINRTL
jgi:hypothetical protein